MQPIAHPGSLLLILAESGRGVTQRCRSRAAALRRQPLTPITSSALTSPPLGVSLRCSSAAARLASSAPQRGASQAQRSNRQYQVYDSPLALRNLAESLRRGARTAEELQGVAMGDSDALLEDPKVRERVGSLLSQLSTQQHRMEMGFVGHVGSRRATGLAEEVRSADALEGILASKSRMVASPIYIDPKAKGARFAQQVSIRRDASKLCNAQTVLRSGRPGEPQSPVRASVEPRPIPSVDRAHNLGDRFVVFTPDFFNGVQGCGGGGAGASPGRRGGEDLAMLAPVMHSHGFASAVFPEGAPVQDMGATARSAQLSGGVLDKLSLCTTPSLRAFVASLRDGGYRMLLTAPHLRDTHLPARLRGSVFSASTIPFIGANERIAVVACGGVPPPSLLRYADAVLCSEGVASPEGIAALPVPLDPSLLLISALSRVRWDMSQVSQADADVLFRQRRHP
eukprot:TRINITY_DN2898_c1_g3_i1.p1 TRINITY_DN2898_c1_g3~~TRINITY_DN2898_c1_g3_i1.p1  ORF type:complete len:507 (+),score=99.87 TRINITY_DN2898_c1_g3_i1:159-1523(+)